MFCLLFLGAAFRWCLGREDEVCLTGRVRGPRLLFCLFLSCWPHLSQHLAWSLDQLISCMGLGFVLSLIVGGLRDRSIMLTAIQAL